ncbi:MAG: hypothetical protein M9962_02985 [Oligoflexia bacterium]|nr:hypothetical protein [Oligoflexia bacterium]
MRIFLLFLFASSLSQVTFADRDPGDGTIIGNGGGSIEQSLIYSWDHLETFLSPCIADQNCYKTNLGKTFLEKILNSHSKEKEKRLKFLFNKDSEISFTTGTNIGAEITINTAPLYKNQLFLSLGSSADFLLKVLSHHHGSLGSEGLKQVQNSLDQFWSARIESADLRKIDHTEISAFVFLDKNDTFFLGTGEGFVDLSDKVRHQLSCFKNAQATLFSLTRFSWLKPEKLDENTLHLSLYGNISYSCEEKQYRGMFQLVFPAKVEKGSADDFLNHPSEYRLNISTSPTLHLYDIH